MARKSSYVELSRGELVELIRRGRLSVAHKENKIIKIEADLRLLKHRCIFYKKRYDAMKNRFKQKNASNVNFTRMLTEDKNNGRRKAR
jgi:hypothetical protein